MGVSFQLMQHEIKGLRVFVVEDDVAILMLAEDMLEELGCVIAVTGTRMREAIDAAQNCQADVALLDVNLAGQPVYPVAEIIERRGIPIVFCIGYGGDRRCDVREPALKLFPSAPGLPERSVFSFFMARPFLTGGENRSSPPASPDRARNRPRCRATSGSPAVCAPGSRDS
jgi:CheY-like chemotaxis protein